MSLTPSPPRVRSMDQFRGYTIVGMFVVNFLGELDFTPEIFKHHNTYFSLADSVLPGFLFACGFSYRLTALRRLAQRGPWRTYGGFAVRSLMLVLISLMMFGFGDRLRDWSDVSAARVGELVACLLKANLWEVLSIIGVTQLLLMPVVARGAAVRVAALAGLGLLHVLVSYSFNYEFVHARPNWMDAYWGAADCRCWDGGAFGLLTWSVPMLCGTLAYDALQGVSSATAARRLVAGGCALMAGGYLLSCLTTLYDIDSAGEAGPAVAVSPARPSPVRPPLERVAGRPLGSLLAEPPFVPPPSPRERQPNYWMMDKRVVSLTFVLFGSGFALATYAAFVLVCDVGGRESSLLGTFGQNPLAAYIIHYPVAHVLLTVTPEDSPVWWGLCGFGLFFGIVFLFVRGLERQKLYLRL